MEEDSKWDRAMQLMAEVLYDDAMEAGVSPDVLDPAGQLEVSWDSIVSEVTTRMLAISKQS